MRWVTWIVCPLALLALGTGLAIAGGPKKPEPDPYAAYVWPPPPDEGRIRLVNILHGRADVEAKGKLSKRLFGATPQSKYDRLRKPFAAEYDDRGRLLVTDQALGAVIRFDFAGRRYDVFGTAGPLRLEWPLGLAIGRDGRIYVADPNLKRVVAFTPEGEVAAAYGRAGELENPTDAVTSVDGARLLVTDSKKHSIVVFELASGKVVSAIGRRGVGEGEFNFPSALALGRGGELFVVDQGNARVQVLSAEGAFIDALGGLGVGFGNFVRPKDVAVDAQGWIYVTDAAFNNVQVFNDEGALLTFVGAGGEGPGEFQGAGGAAVRGDEFAVVDQLNARVQLFRYLKPRAGEKPAP